MRSRLTTAEGRRCLELSPASIPAFITAARGENRRPEAIAAAAPRSLPPLVNGPRPSSVSFAGPAQAQKFGPTLRSGPAALPGGSPFGRA
ncbi:hypothetical protein CRG98_049557, partial [Punica granatum]